jgi:hypothetical protein
VPFSCRLRSASSITKPVVAKPITMAVSTSACGKRVGHRAVADQIGLALNHSRPMTKMNTLTA